MFTPIPGSVALLASGSVLLICSSPFFRRWMQTRRSKSPLFNKLVSSVERRAGERLGGPLRLTRPQQNEEHEDPGHA